MCLFKKGIRMTVISIVQNQAISELTKIYLNKFMFLSNDASITEEAYIVIRAKAEGLSPNQIKIY